MRDAVSRGESLRGRDLSGVDLSGVFADSSAQTGLDSVFWHLPGNNRGNQNEGPQSIIRTRVGETDWSSWKMIAAEM